MVYLRSPTLSRECWEYYFPDTYEGHCFCCFKPIHQTCKGHIKTDDSYMVGHIIPYAEKPYKDNKFNTVPLCRPCNAGHDKYYKLHSGVKAGLDEYAYNMRYMKGYSYIRSLKEIGIENERVETDDGFYMHELYHIYSGDSNLTDEEIIKEMYSTVVLINSL